MAQQEGYAEASVLVLRPKVAQCRPTGSISGKGVIEDNAFANVASESAEETGSRKYTQRKVELSRTVLLKQREALVQAVFLGAAPLSE